MALLTADNLSKTFTGTGQSDSLLVQGPCGMSIDFGVGTVALQGSYDNGTTWFTLKMPDGSTDASWTADIMLELYFQMPTQVRFNCSAYTSGNIICSLSRLGGSTRLS